MTAIFCDYNAVLRPSDLSHEGKFIYAKGQIVPMDADQSAFVGKLIEGGSEFTLEWDDEWADWIPCIDCRI